MRVLLLSLSLLALSLDAASASASASASATWHVAVVETMPKMIERLDNVTRAQAKALMLSNVAVYETQIAAALAREPDTDLVVFAEDCLYGVLFLDRHALLPFLEPLPAWPAARGYVACDDERAHSLTPVLAAMSCAARRHAVALVFDMGDRQPCSTRADGRCPHDDGRVQYNTAIALDHRGALVAKYHKSHLTGHEVHIFDVPPRPFAPVFVDAAWGVRLGLLVCYDLVFAEPLRSLLAPPIAVDALVVPMWWVNSLPRESAAGFQASIAAFYNTTMIVANGGAGALTSGIGVYAANRTLVQSYDATPTYTPVLLLAALPVPTHALARARAYRAELRELRELRKLRKLHTLHSGDRRTRVSGDHVVVVRDGELDERTSSTTGGAVGGGRVGAGSLAAHRHRVGDQRRPTGNWRTRQQMRENRASSSARLSTLDNVARPIGGVRVDPNVGRRDDVDVDVDVDVAVDVDDTVGETAVARIDEGYNTTVRAHYFSLAAHTHAVVSLDGVGACVVDADVRNQTSAIYVVSIAHEVYTGTPQHGVLRNDFRSFVYCSLWRCAPGSKRKSTHECAIDVDGDDRVRRSPFARLRVELAVTNRTLHTHIAADSSMWGGYISPSVGRAYSPADIGFAFDRGALWHDVDAQEHAFASAHLIVGYD